MRTRRYQRLGRVVRFAAFAAFVLAAGTVWYAGDRLTGSLPLLDGEVEVDGLAEPVTVARDALGIPTITAASRRDAARALGFLHAQDRFFQMDLQRRQAAGELAALVGGRALPADRAMRVHRFRHIAHDALARTAPDYRAILEAYAAGVNAGLGAMTDAPFEYLLLDRTPSPWLAEDSILTILAMFDTLQGRQAGFERALGAIDAVLPPALSAFLTARGSEWDAPVVGSRSVRPSIPGPEVFDMRKRRTHATPGPVQRASRESAADPLDSFAPRLTAAEASGIGSNSWVVSGTHTASGAALVANDMHLAIRVPNIWYRAVMQIPDAAAAGEPLVLAGVTLPGFPGMVVGSNGYVAWGFTNSGGDWSDLVIVEPDAHDPARYLAPDGPHRFDDFDEVIEVAGGDAETVRVRWTIWGPIVGTDVRGRLLAQRWVAHDAAILALNALAPETARSTVDALDRFAGVGIPGQNVVVGDRDGHIGWTIAGPIPRRRGHDGLTPTSWADGTRGWDGYLAPDEVPRIVDPPSGRIWTANAPVVDGRMLETIGEGGYADGIRARMIRDRLMGLEHATPADMLAIQLDDDALFLERWRRLVLAVLSDAVVASDPRRAEFRRLVESTWTGHASPDSVAYRVVRAVRQILSRDVLAAIAAPVGDVDPGFDFTRTLRSEGPLWALVTERPVHLLDPLYASWEARILAAIDEVVDEITADGTELADSTWGRVNRARVVHPLAGALPFLGRWLNMPDDPLPGDVFTPRAHSPRTGPSERIVVSPGREAEGIAHMPAGQSGHPLSPHYRDEHDAWVHGRPLPFLPGPPQHTLILKPTQGPTASQ